VAGETRYVIVGAGAVGGTLAARLIDAGRSVLLVARGEHAEAIHDHGLELATPDRRILARVETVPSAAELVLAPGDVILVAVKSQDTAALLPVLARLPVGDRTASAVTPFVSFQNGVENERAARRFFQHVHGVSVALPSTYLEPGRVRAEGAPHSGVLELGRVPGGPDAVDERLAADLTASGFATRIRSDVMAWKRAKLLRNLGNAVEALVGVDDPDPHADDSASASASAAEHRAGIREIVARTTAEGVECFEAAGLSYVSTAEYNEGRSALMTMREVDGTARAGGSTWQSLARRTGSVETDYLNGEIVQLGRALGISTPVNAELQRRMQLAANGDPGGTDVRELLEVVRSA
jgi:2-dehydropantoate 2-reductase